MRSRRSWLTDGLVGGAIGGVVGGVVAVNFVIFSGIEPGYEATIPEVFRQSMLAGIMTIAILVAGPVVGVWVMRRRRRRNVPTSLGA